MFAVFKYSKEDGTPNFKDDGTTPDYDREKGSPEYKDRWKVHIQIRFRPNVRTTASDSINFIQIVRTLNIKTRKCLLSAYENTDLPRLVRGGVRHDGWTVDSKWPIPVPWYVINTKTGADEDSNVGQVGNTKQRKDAILNDDPSWNAPNSIWEFETFAISRSGKDAGQIYGGVSWGFKVVNNVVSLTTPRFLPEVTPEFLSALDLWNKQARLEEVPKKNSRNQQEVPIEGLKPVRPNFGGREPGPPALANPADRVV
jgi:hypothetical protein